MRHLFYSRGLLLLWAIITGSTILSDYLKQYAEDLSQFSTENIRATHEAVLRWILAFAESFLKSIAPKMNDKAFEFALPILNFKVAPLVHDVILLVDIIILISAIFIYRRAIKSDSFFDDFLALLVLYVVIVFDTAVIVNLHVAPWLDNIQRHFVAVGMVLLLLWAMGKKALNDSKIFFRGLLQVVLVGLVMLPDYTVQTLVEVLRGILQFGLFLKDNPIIFALWTGLGVASAAIQLYSASPPPPKPKENPLLKYVIELEKFKALLEVMQENDKKGNEQPKKKRFLGLF